MAPKSTRRALCTFFIDELWFGIDVLEVREVIGLASSTVVPRSSELLAGLMNIRGEIVTVVDVRRVLGYDEPANLEHPPVNIVVDDVDGTAVSLLVDEVGGVVQVLESEADPTPSTVPAAVRGLITGVHQRDGKLLLELDHRRVVDQPLVVPEPV